LPLPVQQKIRLAIRIVIAMIAANAATLIGARRSD
jgi:hypothetical protein